MTMKTFVSGIGLDVAKKVAFSADEASIIRYMTSGKTISQLLVLNTADQLLAQSAAQSAADIVIDIMRTQSRKIGQYGETAYGFSEKQAAVIARDIIVRRKSII